ncbi:MAG: glycosyltransferase [Cyanobacteria bacterium P01_F01_bin.116]
MKQSITTSSVISNDAPKVCIRLPVFNGENYLREAIESILSKTFKDFSLVISDNCSTDSTQQIFEEYAAKDSRILSVRQSENIGLKASLKMSISETMTFV